MQVTPNYWQTSPYTANILPSSYSPPPPSQSLSSPFSFNQLSLGKTNPLLFAPAASQHLKEGNVAPNFILNDQNGKSVSLYQELKKGPVVLFFYPKDGSHYCTIQAREFNKYYPLLKDKASVYGISADSEQSHRDFAKAVNGEAGLPYQLLSDPNDQVRQQYGAHSLWGYFPGRVTFVIESDPEPRIKMAHASQTNIKEHIQFVSKALGIPDPYLQPPGTQLISPY
jgi:thioredoxin-dependent peroxiredoxin